MENPKNDKLTEIALQQTSKHFINAAVSALLTVLLVWGASRYPQAVENVFRPFSRFILNVLAWVFHFIPFSAAEILLGFVVVGAVIALVRLVVKLIAGPRRWLALLSCFARALSFAASLAFAFTLLWGLNYYAPPLAKTLSLPVQNRSAGELADLAVYLADRANQLAPTIPRDATGHVPKADWKTLSKDVADAFSQTTNRPELPVKRILLSEALSHMKVSGIFTPYTGEANVNTNNTATDLPFTMAHELAHRYAIAPENEANFFAFYTLYDSTSPLLAYSATLSALRMTQNALAGADYPRFVEIYESYNQHVLTDLREYSRHWAQYEGKVAEVASKVYDSYLVAQGQESGIKSYGEMVDLLLAWFVVSVP